MDAVEQAKGRVKQAIGDLTDDASLKSEGAAQGGKGAEEQKESEARAKAQAHEQRAETQAERQDAAES